MNEVKNVDRGFRRLTATEQSEYRKEYLDGLIFQLINIRKKEIKMGIKSREYLLYLEGHMNSVKKGFEFIRDKCPQLLKEEEGVDYEWHICLNHDNTKYEVEEFDAYDKYFYGGNRSHEVVQDFKYAWLHHIHNNPHHWQHWILVNDEEETEILDMDYVYILEMVCDWWSFSWTKGNPYEIFDWYEERKERIQLSNRTRDTVEWILASLKAVLGEVE